MNMRIIGSGSCIPEKRVVNRDFEKHIFLDGKGQLLDQTTESIISKFKSITGIDERRYVSCHLLTSDMAVVAAQKAIAHAGIDTESIDYIIVAHNFGDIRFGAIQSDCVPSLASRVKHKLSIKNPKCVAYDIIFGCPGWIEAMIQANAYIRSGMARRCLVIGAESLSRVADKYDRDSMIYADGAGAAIVEATEVHAGLLSHETASYTFTEAGFLYFGRSYNEKLNPDVRHIKMYGHKIYEFALTHVPCAMKACLDKAGIEIGQLKKILIHQANEKMDEAIVQRFFKLYKASPPAHIMPMSINLLGNSSVATVPTLYDLIVRGEMKGHQINQGDVILFASVGAGMNINAFVYRV